MNKSILVKSISIIGISSGFFLFSNTITGSAATNHIQHQQTIKIDWKKYRIDDPQTKADKKLIDKEFNKIKSQAKKADAKKSTGKSSHQDSRSKTEIKKLKRDQARLDDYKPHKISSIKVVADHFRINPAQLTREYHVTRVLPGIPMRNQYQAQVDHNNHHRY